MALPIYKMADALHGQNAAMEKSHKNRLERFLFSNRGGFAGYFPKRAKMC